jgi:hypothetical protein
MVQRHHIAVDDPVSELGAGGDDLRKLGRPIQALAGQQVALPPPFRSSMR